MQLLPAPAAGPPDRAGLCYASEEWLTLEAPRECTGALSVQKSCVL